MPKKIISIYSYNDYRNFLKDFFQKRKEKVRSFSLRAFAQKAGISSHSFISAIIKGRRDLTNVAREKMLKGLDLDKNESRFFSTLVEYNQSKTTQDKEQFFEELNYLRRNTKYYHLNKSHFDYFSQWYFFVIRELAISTDWNGDYATLAGMVNPPIKPAQAKKAIAALVHMGLLVQNKDGSYAQRDKIVSTAEIPGHLIRTMRAQFIELSRRASEETAPKDRNLASTTLTLSKKNYSKAVAILDEARKKIISLSIDQDAAIKTFQANLHLFPMSEEFNVPPQRKGGKK